VIGERRKATYRLIGYLMIVAATVLFGFNGTLSRLLLDDGVSLITLVEMRMLIVGVAILQYEKQDIQNASAN
jgi:drug/metabolite transporter (DMT)-like permease